MKTLASKSRQELRAKAHALKPVILIGSKGLTEPVQQEINLALEAHELIKIKINDHDRDAIAQMKVAICEHQQAHLVQTLGHVITIWRRKKQ